MGGSTPRLPEFIMVLSLSPSPSVYLDVCPRLSASGQGASPSRRQQQLLVLWLCMMTY